jgi:hypothetical protein
MKGLRAVTRRGDRGRRVALSLATFLLIGSVVVASLAIAKVNRYEIDRVTIRVDRAHDKVYGKVVADSTVSHFCSSGQWPVDVFQAKRGKDDKVAHTFTNYSSVWRFKVPQRLAGKRLYARVPSFPNSGNGFCVGARSRAVTAP